MNTTTWDSFKLPSIPPIDMADPSVLLDPHLNPFDKRYGYFANGVPAVLKEGNIVEIPNTRGIQEISNGVPYFISKALGNNQTIHEDRNYYNQMKVMEIPNGKLLIYSKTEGSFEYAFFNGEIVIKNSIEVGGIIRKIGIIEHNLWKNPSINIQIPTIFYVSNESNIFLYVYENGNVIRVQEFHVKGKIDDIDIVLTDNIHLIIATNNKIHYLNVKTKADIIFPIPFRNGDEGEMRIHYSLFPYLIVCKGFGMYTLNILTKEVIIRYGFDEKIVAVSSNIAFPFHIFVLTETVLHIMDSRTYVGIKSFIHLIPKHHLYYIIETFTNNNKLVCVIAGRKYCLIIPFEFNIEKSQFDVEYASCIVKIPVVFPINKQREGYRLIGFKAINHGDEVIMMLIDSERRITVQEFKYGKYSDDIKRHSVILSTEHAPERPLPAIRKEVNVYKIIMERNRLIHEEDVRSKELFEKYCSSGRRAKNLERKRIRRTEDLKRKSEIKIERKNDIKAERERRRKRKEELKNQRDLKKQKDKEKKPKKGGSKSKVVNISSL